MKEWGRGFLDASLLAKGTFLLHVVLSPLPVNFSGFGGLIREQQWVKYSNFLAQNSILKTNSSGVCLIKAGFIWLPLYFYQAFLAAWLKAPAADQTDLTRIHIT